MASGGSAYRVSAMRFEGTWARCPCYDMIPDTAAVATPHPDAAAAAKEILLKGGNAIDAAVAGMLAVCVATPHQAGRGGYGGNLVAYLADQNRVVAIDFDSRAPNAFTPDLYRNPESAFVGYLALSIPAVVAGLDQALRSFGKLPWKTVSQPAIALAENGFVFAADFKHQIDCGPAKTAAPPRGSSPPIPQVGQRFVQKDLA